MRDEDHQAHGLKALESALAALVPRSATLCRDEALFLAGAASARRPAPVRWLWPLCVGLTATVAAVVGHWSAGGLVPGEGAAPPVAKAGPPAASVQPGSTLAATAPDLDLRRPPYVLTRDLLLWGGVELTSARAGDGTHSGAGPRTWMEMRRDWQQATASDPLDML
jgi:hypothetical protein